MCPLWPLHLIFLYLLALCPIWFASCHLLTKAATWSVVFNPGQVKRLPEGHIRNVNFSLKSYEDKNLDDYVIRALIEDPVIASASQPEILFKSDNGTLWGSFNVSGNYLGYTSAKLCGYDKNSEVKSNPPVKCEAESETLKISIIREKTVLDRIFTVTVISLVSIIFINFGCTLDALRLKEALLHPVGPVIGLLSHFLLLPLISYGLGLVFFPDSPMLRLGLFFTGIAPAGGASNIWTFSLGGNLDLSITMTAISTLASFALIPAWVFTLGMSIFNDGEMAVPYKNLLTSGLSPFISLIIGYFIQVYWKRLSNLMVKILKPFSVLLILFIVIFATITNYHLFQLFSWQIILGGMFLPWLGYAGGWIFSSLLGQPIENKLAITIETGVQNTGISIFLLRTCLPQPDSDITTIVPVSVALMTPIPLILYALFRKVTGRSKKDILQEKHLEDSQPCINTVEKPKF